MLELPYIKFIYILNVGGKLVLSCTGLNKINKKILCFIVDIFLCTMKRVNQQETFVTITKGSSETTRDITYNFEEYSNLIPEHKNKINTQFLE